MAITIQPNPETGQLTLSGDIRETLPLPVPPEGAPCAPHYIALSDGSLIRAIFSNDPTFEVVTEGAGVISIDQGRSLSVSWNIEWINVAPHRHGCAVAQKSFADLPLFRGAPAAALPLQ